MILIVFLSTLCGNLLALNEQLMPLSVQVARGDTLYSLSKNLFSGEKVSPQQVMLAYQRINPTAFKRRNINGLYAGVRLMSPTLSEALRLAPREAMSEVRRQNELYSIVTSEASEEVLALMDRNVALDSRIAELELLIRAKDGENAALSRRLTSLSTRLDETDKEVSLLKLQIASLDLQLKTANEIKVVDEGTSLSAVPKLNAENSISPQSQSAQSETGLLAISILGVVVVSLLSFLWLRRRGNDHNSEPTHNRASSAGGRESDKRASLSPNIEPELQTPSGEISQEDEKPASETQFENQEVMYGIEDPDSELNSNDEASEDEIATKLELAYAYSKMGDMESVRKILGEVVGVANASQRVEAENLMKGLLEPDDGRDKEE